MAKDGFYIALVIVIVAAVGGLLAFVAPLIRDAGVAVISIKAAPELAKATVDAAQYALQKQKDADAVALEGARQEIKDRSKVADAVAARTVQEAINQGEEIKARNNLYLQVALGVLTLIGMGIVSALVYVASGQITEYKQLALTEQKQTMEFGIKEKEIAVIGKMVDAAIVNGFTVTIPTGHTFTPPPKQIGAGESLKSSAPAYEPAKKESESSPSR